jgi:hypothetical protein
MKFAVSAVFAFALAAGNTGCCLFHCGHNMGCDGFQDGCGGCDDQACDGACGQRACGGGCGGCGSCGAMGCGPLSWVFDWSRRHDCCDECGNWTGRGMIVSTNRGYVNQPESMPMEYDEPAPDVSAGRVVPGSMRVTTRSAEPGPTIASEESTPAPRRSTATATQRRPKRISSSPMRAR